MDWNVIAQSGVAVLLMAIGFKFYRDDVNTQRAEDRADRLAVNEAHSAHVKDLIDSHRVDMERMQQSSGEALRLAEQRYTNLLAKTFKDKGDPIPP
jgi:hypothetical protein